MVESLGILILLGLGFNTFAQHNSLLLNSYFKDILFNPSGNQHHYQGSSFLPAFESDFDLNHYNRDSSKQYYDLTEILYKKHLLEFKGENYYLTISPVLELAKGKDFEDTNERTLFQNTRGIFIEGDLMKSVSFSTSFYENQGRFSQYETAYYSSVGELYPNQSAGKYTTQNAVIPGGARTKPFKVDGFDYGFAMGNLNYSPFKKLTISIGNTQHFIGDGYRSLLLSDNSVPAPFFRTVYKVTPKFEFNYLRMRAFNLMRHPLSTTVEAYYETKAFSVNYYTFKPKENLSISLFEGVLWTRGDSIVSTHVNPLFFNPVPIVSGLILKDTAVNPIIGLNLSYVLLKSHRIYGQFAISQKMTDQMAFQLGYRGYNLFMIKSLMAQLEYNNVSSAMYESTNNRLNYSHYNLPLAHPKGNGFQEIIFRANYEYKRFYIDLKSVNYIIKNRRELSLLPVDKVHLPKDGTVSLNQLEAGYRFNRKMNLCLFGSIQLRSSSIEFDTPKTSIISIGLKTAITNRYTDF